MKIPILVDAVTDDGSQATKWKLMRGRWITINLNERGRKVLKNEKFILWHKQSLLAGYPVTLPVQKFLKKVSI